MNNLKKEIKEYAYKLGFCEIGFTRYQKLSEEMKFYLQWQENGYFATMTYLEKNLDKRKDIRLILEDVKTIIVVGYSYLNRYNHKSQQFKISRYAWGEDYHYVLSDKLKQLIEFIRQRKDGLNYKIYVDTGPILEKIWAVLAGIGWQGKNSLIISKKYGSYIFLGIILINLDLEPDIPLKDFCGTCTKCIDNCPTKAIVQPKVIDSRKCISYWTIEAKPDYNIPSSIDLNGWIFGCDICQEVCPWNKKALKALTQENVEFYPRNNETNLSYEFLENLNPEVFTDRFRKSPIKRVKFKGLIRNFNHIIKKQYESK